MDITNRLLLFLDVIERGSYAKAAELRQIDRSVVSKQITKLEDTLGVRLLNRTTRTFSLTAAGVEVKRKAEILRKSLQDTIATAQNFHTEPKGLLKITAISSISKTILQPVIDSFQKQYPEVVIELRVESRVLDIIGEGFDIAFRSGELQDSSLIARKLARNRPILLASPEYLERYGEPKTIEELQHYPAAGYAADNYRSSQLTYVDNNNQNMQIPMNCTFYSNDVEFMMHETLAGNVYCLSLAAQITDEITSGKLIPILTDVKLPFYNPFYAVYPHRDMSIRTRLFLDAVRDYIGEEIPRWENNIPNFEYMYGNPTHHEWDR